MTKIEKAFYEREDVVRIAKELLGKYVFTCFDGMRTGGMITETEAYAGAMDKASHAYNNRRTQRTEVMYAEGGTAYVYLCYGMHSLFNVVTHQKDVPHAVLIRAIEPTEGIELMLQRTSKQQLTKDFGIGPGKVAKALGIHYSHSGLSLIGNEIWLEDKGIVPNKEEITITTRIGVAHAAEDALLPYRFIFNKQKQT